MNDKTARCLRDEGMTAVYWGSVPEDWLNPGSGARHSSDHVEDS